MPCPALWNNGSKPEGHYAHAESRATSAAARAHRGRRAENSPHNAKDGEAKIRTSIR